MAGPFGDRPVPAGGEPFAVEVQAVATASGVRLVTPAEMEPLLLKARARLRRQRQHPRPIEIEV